MVKLRSLENCLCQLDDYKPFEIEIILNSLICHYKTESIDEIKNMIEMFLFQSFTSSNTVVMKMIFNTFLKIYYENMKVDNCVEIVKYLSSSSSEVREIAVDFVDLFFNFYKTDPVVIFHIRKYKRFFSRLVKNKCFKRVFGGIINEEEIDVYNTHFNINNNEVKYVSKLQKYLKNINIAEFDQISSLTTVVTLFLQRIRFKKKFF